MNTLHAFTAVLALLGGAPKHSADMSGARAGTAGNPVGAAQGAGASTGTGAFGNPGTGGFGAQAGGNPTAVSAALGTAGQAATATPGASSGAAASGPPLYYFSPGVGSVPAGPPAGAGVSAGQQGGSSV